MNTLSIHSFFPYFSSISKQIVYRNRLTCKLYNENDLWDKPEIGMNECAKNGLEMVNIPMYGWQTEINSYHMNTLHENDLLYDSKINRSKETPVK